MARPIRLSLLLSGGKKARDELDSTASKFEKFKSGVEKMKRPALAGLAAVGGAAFKAAQDASQLGDTMQATQVIFGTATKSVESFSRGAAKSFGISQESALQAADTFGTFGKSAGLTGTKLADFSTKFTALAGDMASFRGGSPEDAIVAIGAALRGETEPIRRYGVLLDDMTLRQQAFALGLTTTTHTVLTPQQRVLAATVQIFKQTTDAQGDFARTATSAKNQEEVLKASLADFSVMMGTQLLPALTQIVGKLNEWLGIMSRHPTTVKVLAIAIGVLSIAVLAMNAGFAVAQAIVIGYDVAVGIATGIQWLFNASLYACPIVWIIAGILAVIAIIVLLVLNWRRVVDAFTFLWRKIGDGLTWLRSNWPLVLPIILGPLGLLVSLVYLYFDDIVGFVKGLPGRIAAAASGMWDSIKNGFKGAVNGMIAIWNKLGFKVPAIDIPHIGKIGGFSLMVPPIPAFGSGGIVSSPTLALIGESGPEAVVPLNQLGGGGNTYYQITFQVPPTVDYAEVGRQVVQTIEAYERRTGRKRLA